MTQEFYGKDLARYKLERAKEELDTAELLFNNDRLLKDIKILLGILIKIMSIRVCFLKKLEEV